MRRKLYAATIVLSVIISVLVAGPASADSTTGETRTRLTDADAPADVPAGDVSPFIVSGERATSSRGLAAIHVNGQFVCSGSIIAPRWVLTAKHCVQGNRSETITVRVKSLNRSSGGGVVGVIESDSVVRSVHDIALVRLSRSANAEYVRLASAHPKLNTTNYVFGWGRTCPGCSPATYLRRATVTVRSIGKGRHGTEIRSAPGNGSPCYGDSGGPLFKLVNGKRYQVGVVSWGTVESACRGSSFYASVPVSRAWIRNVAGV